MCGIVGYVGPRDATPIIFEGLKRLEYRGYDSAGMAVIQDGGIEIRRDAGKIERLGDLILEDPIHGNIGIGHTRWATHGEPSARNAHPHIGSSGDVVVVHNGIVENFLSLRDELGAEGVSFNSDTDTEIIVHLVERYLAMGHDFAEAARRAIGHLKGAHGIVLMSLHEPEKIVAARVGNAGGVVVGVGEGEMFVASDLPAILEHTREVAFLESAQIAIVQREGFEVRSLDGEKVDVEAQIVPWDPISAEKGEYKHFMLKEIFEQVRSTTDTIAGRVDFDGSST
jgi:glucosamine--fructose-6-phosphate aminotransferase (isomerizing)